MTTATATGPATEQPPFDTTGANKFTTAPNAAALLITKDAYERITDVAGWARLTGEAIAASGMFGVGTPAAGYMIAMHCYLTRTSPLDWARTFYIVEGKQTMRADTMLARYREAGGRIEWKKFGDEENADRVEAKWTIEGKSYTIAYTLADAERAGLVGKSNWRKNPGEMMRARLVSKAVRMLAPETISGVYCPEDLGEAGISNDPQLVPVANEERTPQIHVPQTAPVATKPAADPLGYTEADDRERNDSDTCAAIPKKDVPTSPAAPAPATPPPTLATANPSTKGQHSEIAGLKSALAIPKEQWEKILTKRNVTTARDLNYEQAQELIASLEGIKRKRLAEAPNPQVEADKQNVGELNAWANGALAPR